MSSSLPAGQSAILPAPPWQYSSSLGGEFLYDPNADELVLRNGQRFARPRQVPRSSLMHASWVGTSPFQYSGSPPTDHTSRPPRTNSTAFQYSGSPPTRDPPQPPVIDSPAFQYTGSPPTARPSQPPWTNSTVLGGEFYYDPQTDEIVMRDGRRFHRPRHMPAHSLPAIARGDPNRNPSPISGNSGPYLLGGSRKQTEPTGRSQLRSMDPAAGAQMQRFMPRDEPAVVFTRSKAQERSELQITSSGGLDPLPIRVAPPSMQEELFSDYKIRSSRFWKTGRVFLVLWSEPAGGNPTMVGRQHGVVINHLGTRVFSKVRRFVVIRESDNYCSAVPINTYGGHGVAKRGVKKSDHAIIYTGKTEPRIRTDELPKPGEAGMQPTPIRVDPDNPTEQLDPMSRIHLGAVTTVQHNIKVKAFGLVNPASADALQCQFRNVWGLSTDTPVKRDSDVQGDRQGKDRGRIDDSEEEEDDSEDDDEYDEEDEEESDDDDFEEVQHEEKPKEPPHKSVSQAVDQSSKSPVTSKKAEKKPTV
jgi:hypothetical protein